MSRSALARQTIAKSLAMQANPPMDDEEEGYERHVKNDELPIHGNETTYNLNSLLHRNIIQSPYFHELYKFKTYHEIVDEIYYRVNHAEPFAPGTARMPSTCFCLLFKCFTMRLTKKQMKNMLQHVDSPYIRTIGFLYLRYTMDPEELWTWFKPFLEDPEEFNASANPKDIITIGKWVKSLLEENNYFGTILPRIPKKIQDRIKVNLLLHHRCQERAQTNLSIVSYLIPGTKVRGMYSDAENEPAMYDAVIDSVEGNEYWVTFPEYGNTEKLTLGEIEYEKPDSPSRSSRGSSRRDRDRSRSSSRTHSRHRSRSSSRTRSHRRRSRSSSRDRSSRKSRHYRSRSRTRSASPSKPKGGVSSSALTEDLMAQVREQERRKAAAVGKDYAARPASYKGSLSMKIDRFTTRRQSPTKKTVVPRRPRPSESNSIENTNGTSVSTKPPPISQEALGRLEKLRHLYGDASANCAPNQD